jgi:hypothetical protein
MARVARATPLPLRLLRPSPAYPRQRAAARPRPAARRVPGRLIEVGRLASVPQLPPRR